MEASLQISVLIRTKNSAKTIRQVISRLGLATHDELIIVDSGSKDSTLKIAKEAGAKLVLPNGPFNYLPGLSACRRCCLS
jgi:glycosyltransferase involved in cell wall biosynthesis